MKNTVLIALKSLINTVIHCSLLVLVCAGCLRSYHVQFHCTYSTFMVPRCGKLTKAGCGQTKCGHAVGVSLILIDTGSTVVFHLAPYCCQIFLIHM
jgi:hypothetical protein